VCRSQTARRQTAARCDLSGAAGRRAGRLARGEEAVEQHPELFEGVGFVLNEGGSNETAVDKVVFWGIEVQQKVPLWLRVTSEAAGGHGASASAHGGATAKLVHALSAIDAIETPYRLTEVVARTAAISAAARTDGGGQAAARASRAARCGAHREGLPPGYRALLRDTITITRLSAGSAVNVVPSRAVAEVDIRLLPGSTRRHAGARARRRSGRTAASTCFWPESRRRRVLVGELYDACRASSAASRRLVGRSAGLARHDRQPLLPRARHRGLRHRPFKVNYYDADACTATTRRSARASSAKAWA
jgi:acetylornithine deacetylase/succinyl-diaminopimelate desuccinylase-like protein